MSNCDSKDKCCGCWANLVQKCFPLVYVVFAFVLLAYGYLLNDRPDQLMDNTLPIMEFPQSKADISKPKAGSVVKGVDLAKVSISTEASVARGKAVYDMTCASCHGSSGDGKGAAGAALNPPPRSFQAAADWKNDRSNGASFYGIYKTLQEGIPGTGMAAYDTMPIVDRIALIHYINTFGTFYPKVSKGDLDKLDKDYQLSQDKVSPNQIPRDMAIELLAEEAKATSDKLDAIVKKIKADQSTAAKLCKSLTSDLKTAVTAVKRSGTLAQTDVALINLISKAPHYYGFKPNVVKLSKSDWSKLHSYLKAQL